MGGNGPVDCSQPGAPPGCDVSVKDPGNSDPGGNGGGRHGDGKCYNPSGTQIPCERDGGWAGSDGCYYTPLGLSPEEIAAMGGQPAGEGGWYEVTCYGDGPDFSRVEWVPGSPPAISPDVLAQQARSRLNLPRVVISLNPSGDQLTNLPVWLSVDPASWQPQTATASVPGLSVTATARPIEATWSMGEGTSVVCAGPGTRWAPGIDPAKASPDCGFTYQHSSAGAPGGTFTVTATVAWEVIWAGGGETGTVPGLTTTGAVAARVQESQTIVTG